MDYRVIILLDLLLIDILFLCLDLAVYLVLLVYIELGLLVLMVCSL